MESTSLCDHCSRINFDSLRNPLLSDSTALREGKVDRSRYPFKEKRNDAHISTTLGTFNDILQRSATCRLCDLIGQLLRRHNSHREPGLQLKDNDLCLAETTFHGMYRDPRGDTHWIRRLSVIVDGDGWKPIGSDRSVYCAFQACNAGAASVQVDETFVDSQPGVDAMVFGGRQRPLLLDLKWVRQWMDICQMEHSEGCARPEVNPNGQIPFIRFIDVRLRRILTMRNVCLWGCRYIALSYVWGGPQRFVLNSANVANMSQAGSLPEESLPRSIEDSILLTKSFQESYLWVDALCIVQDDDEDKKVQITAMGQIYNGAFLTIVAASASDAESGLPGIRYGTRFFQQQEVLVRPGLSLMTTVQPLATRVDHYLEHTRWNSRGWTMQEWVLSRRVLVYTSEQVYWVCRDAIFCEESYYENSLLRFHPFHEQAQEQTLKRTFRNFYEPDGGNLRLWKNYQKLVTGYTRRTFSFQGDAFNGFLAILEGFSSISGESFLWAIPRCRFEQGLMWSTFTGQRRREELSTLAMASKNIRVHFPSWSWMGWIGETFICIDDERCDENTREIPEILCYEHKHAPLRLEQVRHVPAPYQRAAWQSRASWKLRHDQEVTLENLERNRLRLLAALGDIPEEQLLFFWTSLAKFSLVPSNNAAGFRQASILDPQHDVVGTTGPMEGKYMDEGQFDTGQHEFVVIGSRRNAFSDSMLLVLQIRWEDDIAYRVNCGEIAEEAWIKGLSKWQLISLG